ncbi:MAG: threonine/serine exporter family protein [Sneathiellaceae bacterium]
MAEALLAATAHLLFANGQTSEATRITIARLGGALGVQADVLLQWGDLVLSIDGRAVPALRRVRPTAVDMNKVAAALHAVDEVCAGRLDASGARREVEAIALRPPASTLRFAAMAAAGAAALGVIFGAQDPQTLAFIALSAGLGGWLRRGLARLSTNTLVQPFCAALLAGILGGVAVLAHLGIDPRLALVCPCMVLVPGPHLLNGSIDLARARILIGWARLLFAGLILLMICAGLLLGLAATGVGLPQGAAAVAVPLLYDILAAGCAVAAFGSFFSMPWRALAVPVAVGMLAHGARWLLIDAGLSLPAGTFVACLVAGILATLLANRLRFPFAAFAFASVVSMMPGVYLFEAAAALVEIGRLGAGAPAGLLVGAVANGTVALQIVFAMTFGLILPKMVIEGWLAKRRAARPGPAQSL